MSEELLLFLVDSADALRQRYGMQAGGLYLLRPDGYVGSVLTAKDEKLS